MFPAVVLFLGALFQVMAFSARLEGFQSSLSMMPYALTGVRPTWLFNVRISEALLKLAGASSRLKTM